MGLFEKLFGKKIAGQVTPDEDKQYNLFLNDCCARVKQKNLELEQEYGIRKFERWDFDQEVGELEFSDAGQPQLIAKIVIAGTYSLSSKTWMWGWANSSILESLTLPTLRVKEYGLQNGISDFTDSKIGATEDEAWAFAGVACHLLDGKGVYRGPTGQSHVFMVMTDLKPA